MVSLRFHFSNIKEPEQTWFSCEVLWYTLGGPILSLLGWPNISCCLPLTQPWWAKMWKRPKTSWWESLVEQGFHIWWSGFAHLNKDLHSGATGEILLRTVVTPRFICQMDPFYRAGILISQSVYHGQEGKNKMGRFRFCGEICFTAYNGCVKGFCWDVISTLSFTVLPFLFKFLKTDFLNFEQEHDSDTECFLMIMTCFNQDLAGGSGHSSYLSHTPPTAYF